MDWYYINELYLDQLRICENRIPQTNYGNDKWKPFFGILFDTNGLSYVTNISSPKPRHFHMNNDLDFIKVFDSSSTPSDLIAVINLNYMFPVPKKYLQKVDYRLLCTLVTGKSPSELSQYWALLQKELRIINSLSLDVKSLNLYNLDDNYPASRYANRSFDFKKLEVCAKNISV